MYNDRDFKFDIVIGHHGQVHGPRKERRKRRRIRIIIIRNGAKTISLPNFVCFVWET
jgi:hypothetical protein